MWRSKYDELKAFLETNGRKYLIPGDPTGSAGESTTSARRAGRA